MSRRGWTRLVVLVLVTAVLASFSLTGCSTASAKSSFTFLAAQYSTATEPFLKDLVARFEKENPNITVNLQVVGWDVINQRVNTLISTNQAPDLLNIDLFSAYVNDNLLMDASKVISPALKANIYESLYAGNAIKGTTYAIPLLSSVRSLYYNKDIFATAGIATPPKTWSELRADCKLIKEKAAVDAYGIEMTNFEGEAFFSYFAFGNGGGWKKDGKWALNSAENIEAFTFMNDLVNTDKTTNAQPTAINRDELQKVFAAGKLGMMMTANFFPTILKTDAPNLNYGVAPMPCNDGKPQTSLFVQDSLMVFKSTKSVPAITKFLDFFYKDANYQTFLTNEGFLPVTKTVGTAMAASDPMTAEFIKELQSAQTYPVDDTRYPEIKFAAIAALQKVLLGQMSVTDALNEVQATADGTT